MAEVRIANSLILLSRGVNQATRKRCFAGRRTGEGKFVADLHIHGAHVLTRRENIYLGVVFIIPGRYKSLRIQDFVVAARISLSRPTPLVIAQMEPKLSPANSLAHRDHR